MCWEGLCTDLQVVDVPGDHFSLLRQSPRDMGYLVAALQAALGDFGWAETVGRRAGAGAGPEEGAAGGAGAGGGWEGGQQQLAPAQVRPAVGLLLWSDDAHQMQSLQHPECDMA